MSRAGARTPHVAVAATLLALSLAAEPAHAQQRRAGGRAVQAVKAVKGAARALDRAAASRESQKATARYDPLFRKYSRRYFGVGTDWRWFKAQGMAESDLTPGARSRVGARGIMQLMPATYGTIRSALPHFGAIDDPEWNIAAGILHDRDLWQLWTREVPEDGRWAFTFAAYNAGEGTIMRARQAAAAQRLDPSQWPAIERIAPTVTRWRYTETLDYVRRIHANKEALPDR